MSAPSLEGAHWLRVPEGVYSEVAHGFRTFLIVPDDLEFLPSDTLRIWEIARDGEKTGRSVEKRLNVVTHARVADGFIALGFCEMVEVKP